MPDWFPHNLAEVALFTPLRLTFLVIIALVGRFVITRLIDRAARRAISKQPALRVFRPAQAVINAAGQAVVTATGGHMERRSQRILALSSLATSAVSVVILVVVSVMILSELGFNVTSIVAGGSVVAVTIAFGLQSIVKDLISGVFMLIEDQIGVGDYIDLELASGTVEAIGLRVTQLRKVDGTVWYVRNGEVVRVANYSQGGPGAPPQLNVKAARQLVAKRLRGE